MKIAYLFIVLVPVFMAALILNPQSITRLQIILMAAVCYLIIALLHHLKDKTLHLKVMVEYFLLICLVVLLVYGTLFS